MKKHLLTLCFLCISITAFSQTTTTKDAAHKDTLWKIHGQNTLLISQSSFSNWAAGGDNAASINVVLDYDFDYKKGNWSWDNKVILAYGLSDQAGLGWRKNDDRAILNSLLGYKAAKYWLYTFYANFQSQFTNGYSYDAFNNRTLVSAPFAPAYLTFGPGFAYKQSDNFRINFSPLASRITFVQNDSLSSIGAFGVTPGSHTLFEFGASLDAYYKFNIAKNISFENSLKLFSNYLAQPQNVYADYSGNIYMKVNKIVTVNFGIELISDPLATTYHEALQVRQIFGAGVTYKF